MCGSPLTVALSGSSELQESPLKEEADIKTLLHPYISFRLESHKNLTVLCHSSILEVPTPIRTVNSFPMAS